MLAALMPLSRGWQTRSSLVRSGTRCLVGNRGVPARRLPRLSSSREEIHEPTTKGYLEFDVDDGRKFQPTTVVGHLTRDDRRCLALALEHARNGVGHTFPNPAVGCVLVRQDTMEVVGEGFHPRAGFPHAEVFALLEAAGHVRSGIEAAQSVVQGTNGADLQALVDRYKGEDSDDDDSSGPEGLFGDCLSRFPVTAYVTLEPCCHYGKTPPCAASLALAGVERVVVGFRDPNPRVDGGGVKVLEEAGIYVQLARDAGCARIVDNFVKRILPKDYDDTDYSHVTGTVRRSLRRLAGQKKAEDSLVQVAWGGGGKKNKAPKAATDEAVDDLELPPEWMEHLDAVLWREELVNIRLNKAVSKKQLAKRLGHRVARELGAHVAQVVGHTVLLYRPGMPPVLDLDELSASDEGDDESKPSTSSRLEDDDSESSDASEARWQEMLAKIQAQKNEE